MGKLNIVGVDQRHCREGVGPFTVVVGIYDRVVDPARIVSDLAEDGRAVVAECNSGDILGHASCDVGCRIGKLDGLSEVAVFAAYPEYGNRHGGRIVVGAYTGETVASAYNASVRSDGVGDVACAFDYGGQLVPFIVLEIIYRS